MYGASREPSVCLHTDLTGRLLLQGKGPKAISPGMLSTSDPTVNPWCTERLNAGTEAQAYWPSYPVERTLRGKKFTIQRSLFPGYVFARFDLEHRKQLVTLPQIVHILGSDGPLAIPDTEVEAVRKLTLAPQSAVVQPWQYVEAGDEVEIVKGPHSMRGLRGFVVYHKSQLRVVVSVRMLQRSIATEVEASWLRAVKQ